MTKFRNAHVFVVDSDSYPVHRDRLFCGVKNPNKISVIKNSGKKRPNPSYYSLIADLAALRIDDYVIFYQMRKEESKLNRGFRGIFKVASEPFFDTSDVDGLTTSVGPLGSSGKKVLGKCPFCGTSLSEKANARTGEKICNNCGKQLDYHILPNRVLIEPVKVFDDPIDDNTAYIDRNFIKGDLPILWTMLFRKTSGEGRARSITHILPEEFRKLKEIFETNCKEATSNNFHPYKPSNPQGITIPLTINSNGELEIEAYLEAWLMKNLDKNIPVLKDIIGKPDELEYFGNHVLYGIGGENVDILCIHKRGNERIKATVIELKRGPLVVRDVKQIRDYTKWMSQLVFGDDSKDSKAKIQPVLIGFNASEKVTAFAKNMITGTHEPAILTYKINNGTVEFTRVL